VVNRKDRGTHTELPSREDKWEFKEHAVVGFTAHEQGNIEKKAKVITGHARIRGWQFKP